MNALKSIFLSNEMRNKVTEIHESFHRFDAETLLDLVIIGHTATVVSWEQVDDEVKELIKKRMLSTGLNFNDFEVYDLPTCKYMEQRSKLIHYSDKIMELVQKKLSSITVENLEYISGFGHSPMSVFWIKHAALQLGAEQTYEGMQPYTKPVDDATKALFGKPMSQLKHSMLCYSLSKELDVSMSYINTAMWIKGYGY